ncbi:MAG: hypothetical protein JNK43_06480, partial [Ignavibacteria bacterium]|nr:hypothetical protein [Ignavibacteria bacterium]
MRNSKLFFSLAAVLIAVISVGFYSIGSSGDPLQTTAPATDNTPVVTSNNTIDAMVGAWTTGAPIPTTTYFGGGVGYSRNDSGWVFIVGGNGSSTGINNLSIY